MSSVLTNYLCLVLVCLCRIAAIAAHKYAVKVSGNCSLCSGHKDIFRLSFAVFFNRFPGYCAVDRAFFHVLRDKFRVNWLTKSLQI